MKAIDRPFTKIINGTTQFLIPVFQRDYTWTEEECGELWKDILQISDAPGDRGHFLGSVVYVPTGDIAAGFTRWLLIDGQQRLTTLTLLLTAMRDHIVETHWIGSTDGPTARRIEAYFLRNVEEAGSRAPKLVLRRNDQATLQALIDPQSPPAQASERIRDNYEYFREQLRHTDPERVYRGIGRLVVVDVTLDRTTDDPQLVFESLNSTGIDLSQSDLIRNFILMRLPEPEQTRLYEVYWTKIENLFRGSERTFDAFVRDYLALQTRASKQEKADDIYDAFRRHFGSPGADIKRLEELLEDLQRFAGYHAAFSIGTDTPKTLGEPLARLRRLVDVPAILVMRLFDCHARLRTLSESDFAKAIGLIESFVFRRAICGEQTRGYWQVFANLAYRIDPARPFESLSVGLARQRDNYRFPDDEEFRKALEERDVYGKRVCFELLERLENHDSREPTNTSELSIEHIMPQNPELIPEWRSMLGEGWRETQREWLHRLGNLTLTGYNSAYSDRPFDEKKTISRGFAESAVRLNRFVREQPAWTPVEMERRGRAMAQRALEIWPPLEVAPALIEAAREEEMRGQAGRRDVAKVAMSSDARELFDLLRVRVRDLDPEIIEIAEPRSVSYHGPDFFLEVLPRVRKLKLLLALDFNEVDDPAGIAQDATQRKFFFYAQHEGGVMVSLSDPSDIDCAMPLIRQAHALASA